MNKSFTCRFKDRILFSGMRKVKIEIGMTFQEVSCQTLQKKYWVLLSNTRRTNSNAKIQKYLNKDTICYDCIDMTNCVIV
jgi:hypothetical protein